MGNQPDPSFILACSADGAVEAILVEKADAQLRASMYDGAPSEIFPNAPSGGLWFWSGHGEWMSEPRFTPSTYWYAGHVGEDGDYRRPTPQEAEEAIDWLSLPSTRNHREKND